MIGAELLEILNSRLQQINMEFDKPFGGFNIVFCGDLRQLPPVMATAIYKRMRRRFNNQVLWQSLQFYPLVQVVRQSDVTFSSILTKIGDGEKLTDDETAIIESRFDAVEEINQRVPRAIRLFLKNIDVASHNSEVIQKNNQMVEQVALDVYSGYKDKAQLDSMRTKVHKMSVTDTAGLPYMIRFLLGFPYMITCNTDVTDGLVNGAIGVLRYIEYGDEEGDGIKRVWLHFEHSKIGKLLKAKCHAHIASNEDLNNDWVPISKRTTNISFKTRSLSCKRLQFPLVEACALTIHKSQGGTYDSVVYDYNKSHDQQLVYVALSRATTLDGLFLTNKNKDHKFHHARGRVNTELRNEFDRLKNHPLRTISDECREFLSRVGPEDLSLLTLNVQSLRAHKEDLITDFILPETKIMALTETWLNNNDEVGLRGYRCVTQFKREKVRAGGVAMYEKEDCMLLSTPHILMTFDKSALQLDRSMAVSEECGDICAIESTINGQRALIVTVYVSPNSNMEDIQCFFLTNLLMYTPKASEMFELIRNKGYGQIPIILSGDINLDLKKKENQHFVTFMEETFGLQLKTNPMLSTTRGGSCIDLIFTRHIENIDSKNYISYFSFHKPVLSIASN